MKLFLTNSSAGRDLEASVTISDNASMSVLLESFVQLARACGYTESELDVAMHRWLTEPAPFTANTPDDGYWRTYDDNLSPRSTEGLPF